MTTPTRPEPTRTELPLDLAGIGIGPFNLSLAALLDAAGLRNVQFFDQRESFDWHPGMMLPDVALQSSYLRDLVTPVCPTSPLSFLSFLVEKKAFFAFLNAPYEAVPRQEMTNYFAWAARKLDNLNFGSRVREIGFADGLFRLEIDGPAGRRSVASRNISVGTGARPVKPDWASGLDPARAFHCAEAKHRLDGLKGQRVVVVGGGQSGGEAMEYLLSQPADRAPAAITWIGRRHNFEPINETPFSNQVFSPEYVAAYFGLPEDRKPKALEQSLLTSDGLSLHTIDSIYRALYRIRHIEGAGPELDLRPGRSVTDVERQGDRMRLTARNAFDNGTETVEADALVLATGFRFAMPEAIEPLADRFDTDAQGYPQLDAEYAVDWDGPANRRIFALNAGRHSHGIADSQLSLMAWRSATIVNALAGREVFDLALPRNVVDWGSHPAPDPRLQQVSA